MDIMKEYLLDRYASSAFNKCPHEPLPMMKCAPIRIHVKKDAKPITCKTASKVLFHHGRGRYRYLDTVQLHRASWPAGPGTTRGTAAWSRTCCSQRDAWTILRCGTRTWRNTGGGPSGTSTKSPETALLSRQQSLNSVQERSSLLALESHGPVPRISGASLA